MSNNSIHKEFLELCAQIDKQQKTPQKNEDFEIKKRMADFATLIETTVNYLQSEEREKTLEEFLSLFFIEMKLRDQTHQIR